MVDFIHETRGTKIAADGFDFWNQLDIIKRIYWLFYDKQNVNVNR